MQLHQLQANHENYGKKRIGRGGKRGTTSGRGTKGQHSRAGRRIRPAERDFIQHLPKMRGIGNAAHEAKYTKKLVLRRRAHRKGKLTAETEQKSK
jgi:large subunit ribosomal protein L15